MQKTPVTNTECPLSETAQDLWRTNTSVSSQGRARGRAKGLMRIKNLNLGQRLGFGKARVSWPGLTVPAIDKFRKKEQLAPLSKEKLQ